MKNLLIALLAVSFLGGCAASAKQTYTADGKKGYIITCSGSGRNWGMCYEKAGRLCGEKGYIVLEKSSDQGSMIMGTRHGFHGGSVIQRTMLIKCKE